MSWEDHAKLESEVNAHTIQFARILRVGAKWNHWPRVKRAITSHHAPIPPLSGYQKTHKDLSHLPPEEKEKGPEVRPVCDASESNNGPLSELLSEEITKLGDEMDKKIKTLCLSTEEMAGGIEKVNNKEGIKKLSTMSLDAVKMFPRLKADQVARIVKEEYLKADIDTEVEDTEVGLMLAILVEREELERLGLGEVTCRRKRKGKRFLITTKWIVGERGGKAENLFHDPERAPTAEERRLMFAMVVENQGTTHGDIHSGDDLGRCQARKIQCWGDPGHTKQAVLLSVHLSVRSPYSPLGRRAIPLQPKTATFRRS